MDYGSVFEDVALGSIDFSPYQPCEMIKIILDEKELGDASDQRIERFWRVWYKERSFFAPALKTLILGLKPNGDEIRGISRFIEYFETAVVGRCPNVGLQIFLIKREVIKILEIPG